MVRRLLTLLPQEPPEWLVGFWTIYGVLFLASLLLEPLPPGLVNELAYWARLVAAIVCLAVALGLHWRRTHPG